MFFLCFRSKARWENAKFVCSATLIKVNTDLLSLSAPLLFSYFVTNHISNCDPGKGKEKRYSCSSQYLCWGGGALLQQTITHEVNLTFQGTQHRRKTTVVASVVAIYNQERRLSGHRAVAQSCAPSKVGSHELLDIWFTTAADPFEERVCEVARMLEFHYENIWTTTNRLWNAAILVIKCLPVFYISCSKQMNSVITKKYAVIVNERNWSHRLNVILNSFEFVCGYLAVILHQACASWMR